MASDTESAAHQNIQLRTSTKEQKKSNKDEKPVSSYAKSNPRVSKDNMFMILALWMEDFPVKDSTKFVDEDHCRKVGAVLVLPNDIVWAADCSRDGVHAFASLLMKHHDKAKDCKMFMSRKPCRTCAKLLVQSKVNEVLYPPLKPEYYLEPEAEPNEEKRKKTNNNHMKQVDRLFIANAIAQTKFVPQVEKSVLAKKRKDTKQRDTKTKVKELKDSMVTEKYHFDVNSSWLDAIEEELPWPAFDAKMKVEVRKFFADVIEWSIRVRILSGKDKARGLNYTINRNKLSMRPPRNSNNPPFNPEVNDTHAEQAKHLIEMARFLAERTDDPKTGVGAVIASYPEMEIISIGWNGFPRKAHYGEFPRASDDDDAADNKFSYVIHAEQNALMMRNTKNIKDAILFTTKSPCDECAPLIAREGIKTVVVDADVKYRTKTEPNQDEALPAVGSNAFPKMVEKRKFVCYQTENGSKRQKF